ncbi:SixA phosphatase family protein [Roseibium sp.]|uniref:SixA phosphatase family protein n=1 Tax=Roseibium sp. TaxID=1936156 RepID=UPI003A96E012
MPHLLLLRHAKSDWGTPELKDFDRPLNSRGRTAARVMAKYIAESGFKPDLVLCSTAQRTRETLSRLLTVIRHQTDIRLLHTLYDQSEDAYLPAIRSLGGQAQTLMVIGHNPATEETAHLLYGSGAPELKADMELKYPSGALTIYECPAESWADLAPGTCHLKAFVKPRALAGENG